MDNSEIASSQARKGRRYTRRLGVREANLFSFLRMRCLTEEVHEFDGSSPVKYRQWKEEAEWFGKTIGAVDEDYRWIARQRLKGPAGRELNRFLEVTPDATWNQITKALGAKFDDPDKSNTAIYQLSTLRQLPNELVQHYAEWTWWIQILFESAYNATDHNHAIVQQQPVNIFINGMHDDYTHRRRNQTPFWMQ